MKIAIIILLFVAYSCSPEKNIEVRSEYWVLIEKKNATRYFQPDYVWLIWENKNGIRYAERVPDTIAVFYKIGMIISNRIR